MPGLSELDSSTIKRQSEFEVDGASNKGWCSLTGGDGRDRVLPRPGNRNTSVNKIDSDAARLKPRPWKIMFQERQTTYLRVLDWGSSVGRDQ